MSILKGGLVMSDCLQEQTIYRSVLKSGAVVICGAPIS